MADLFTKTMEVALHISSQTNIIIESNHWTNGELLYDCLIPQKDQKGNWVLCNATYNSNELDCAKRSENGLQIEIEQINQTNYGKENFQVQT